MGKPGLAKMAVPLISLWRRVSLAETLIRKSRQRFLCNFPCLNASPRPSLNFHSTSCFAQIMKFFLPLSLYSLHSHFRLHYAQIILAALPQPIFLPLGLGQILFHFCCSETLIVNSHLIPLLWDPGSMSLKSV